MTERTPTAADGHSEHFAHLSLTAGGGPSATPRPAGTLHVVQFSGGIGSWATAMRVAEEHGTDNLILLAADTKAEDPDLWRFVADAGAHLGVNPVIVADGRTPWQVFADQRFVGNSRIAPCSVHLKQKPCRRWLTKNADPERTVLYVGIDWNEQRRVPAIERGWSPWTVRFPMCEPPYLSKDQMLEWATAVGLTPPRLYQQGFTHNFSPRFGDVSASSTKATSSIHPLSLLVALGLTAMMRMARGVVLRTPAAGRAASSA
ncbi:hypothetical protein ACGFJ7_35175 [Actinoplanes sp. NPDC048988]|uniref:hypothetical protein n=1 Tax=Actinoplanes sp. NPDC048988 TaxID=3363901 RepID=UPI003713B1F3